MFGDKEFLDISKDKALSELKALLGLAKIPARIEGFDISHMSGTNVVASMVVFTNGVSDRGQYRKFKTRNELNDDCGNMNETITRRLSQKNLKNWGKPDLVLIDGGKGQLDAALQARDKCGQESIPFIGLAKREEQIVIKSGDGLKLINLSKSTHIIKLLQRIRDESHRFAVSYHTALRRTKQTDSLLEEITGIGPKTRSKLIRKFGSIHGLKIASESEIKAVIGPSKTRLVLTHIKAL
jgi:excinuclease ABC subunit C